MKYNIEVEENTRRKVTFVVEVEDECDGEMLPNVLEEDIEDATHFNDISEAIKKRGYKVVEVVEEPPEVEYELY